MKAPPDPLRSRPGISAIDEKIALPPVDPVLHLAGMIDFKEARLERTIIPFQRKQLTAELESLVRRFQIEYRHFITTTADGAALPRSR